MSSQGSRADPWEIIRELQHQMAEMQAQLRAFQGTAPPPPPPTSAPEEKGRKRSALPAPAPYTGAREKYREFEETYKLHFREDPEYFKKDEHRIVFVLSLLTSDLAAGFRSQWMNEEERAKKRDPTSSYYNTWSNLEKWLQETFKDSAEEQRA